MTFILKKKKAVTEIIISRHSFFFISSFPINLRVYLSKFKGNSIHTVQKFSGWQADTSLKNLRIFKISPSASPVG